MHLKTQRLRLLSIIFGVFFTTFSGALYLFTPQLIDQGARRYLQFRNFETHVYCPPEFSDFTFCRKFGEKIEVLVLGDSMQLGFSQRNSLTLGAGSCPLLWSIVTSNSAKNCLQLSDRIASVLELATDVREVWLVHRSEYLDFQSEEDYRAAIIKLVDQIKRKLGGVEILIVLEPARFTEAVPTCMRRLSFSGKECTNMHSESFSQRLAILDSITKLYPNVSIVAPYSPEKVGYRIYLSCFKDQIHFIHACQDVIYGEQL